MLPHLSPRCRSLPRRRKQSTGLFSSESLWLSPSLFDSRHFDILKKAKDTALRPGLSAFLVEMAGIEPASKNLFLQPSTCLFCLLRFPYTNAGKQALMLGILSPWRGRGTPPLTFTTNRRPYLSRGTLKQDGSLIKLRKQLYFCQLF